MEPRQQRPGEQTRAQLEHVVAVRFKHFGEFDEERSANLSTGGMFVHTRRPQPVGAVFEFRLELSGDGAPLTGKAQVAWVRRRSQYLDRPMGMGARFVELDDPSRRRIAELVAAGGGGSTEIEGAPAADREEAPLEERTVPQPPSEPAVAPAPPPAEPRPEADRGTAVSAAAAEAERRPSRAPWILLAAILAAALVLILWWRPGIWSPTPPARPEPTTTPPPATVTTTAGDTTSAAEAEPVSAVRDWARAWSEQRVDDYLSAYAAEFEPPNGLDRTTWERQRRGRILAPQRIDVGLAFVELEELTPDRVEVSFVQAYESDSYSDVVRKRLLLERRRSGWKILLESLEP